MNVFSNNSQILCLISLLYNLVKGVSTLDYKLLGKRIREVRRKHDLTQEKLAEDINVTHPYIGQVERGERGISIENLVNLCNRLDVTVDYLLSDYYVKDHNEYYKGQWAKLMQSRADFEQDFVLSIVEAVLKNMDTYTESFVSEYESTKYVT